MNIKNETLYHTIAYLVENTGSCYLTKLLKLIYLFDLEHVRKIGIPATNVQYKAWDKGPVIESLRSDILNTNNTEFNHCFNIEAVVVGNCEGYKITPKFQIDLDVFSDVQIKILKKLTKDYKNSSAQDLIKITHNENDPWYIIYEEQGKKGEIIPLEIAVPEQKRTQVKERLELHGRV